MRGALTAAFVRTGLRPALVLGITLMTLWVAAYRQLSPLGIEFYQPSWSGLRGLVLYLRGHHGEAARAYRAGQRGRVRVDYRYDPSGFSALLAGDLTVAEQRAQTTLALVPTAVEPLVTLGEVALERKQFPQALAYLKPLLTRRADHLDALYLSAVARGRLGEHDQAIELLNRALRHPTVPGRSTTLFRVLEVAGDLAERPPREQPLCLLAHLYRYLRIYDASSAARAMVFATQAIVAGDRPADAYLTLGIVHGKVGDHDQALRALQKAIEINPRHAEAYRRAAIFASNFRDYLLEYKMARAMFDAAPTDPLYIPYLEKVMITRLGDPHTMAALMQRAVELDPSNVLAHERLAYAAALIGDGKRAAAHTKIAAGLRGPRATTAEERRDDR